MEVTIARDGNGDYTLPSNTTSPATSGTTISSADFNEVMDDIETALDESVFTAGTSGTDNVVVRADGTSGKKVQESGVAIDDSDNVSGVANLTVDAGGAVRTATGDTNTLLLQAYDVDGTAYTTFATLTAGNTPTFDLASATTINSVAIADISSAQTLTNKTVDLASNTITGTTAEFNTALSDGSFATLAGTETLTNKTLTSPVINVTSDAQGDIYYRDGSGNFARLGPGSAGEVLQTGGAGANPSWTTAGAGDVTSSTTITDNTIVRGDGGAKGVQQSGVAIDDSDNVSGVANLTVDAGGAVRTATSDTNTLLLQAYDVDGAAYTTFATLTAGNTPTFDLSAATTIGTDTIVSLTGSQTLTNKTLTSPVINVGSDAQGDVYYRNASGNFARLAPGSAGQVLQTGGAGADPSWATVAGTGDVTAASGFGTDNVLIRSDGVAKGVQSSGISIDDSDNITGINNVTGVDTNLVSGTAGTSGDLLEWDANGDAITAGTALSELAFRKRALARDTSGTSIPNATLTAVSFASSEDYDTSGFHDLVTNPDRMTVPSGISFVLLQGFLQITAAGGANNFCQVEHFNSSSVSQGVYTAYQNNTYASITTPVISVSSGDYFRFSMYQNSGSSRTLYTDGRCFFAIYAIAE